MTKGTTSIFKSIFHGLSEDALDTFRNLAELHTYPAGTVLCTQGKVEHTFYVVVEGRVAISQKLEDGQERLLSIRGPREYFGELGLLDDTPRFANCVAITDVTVLEITEEVFQSVLEKSPAVAYAMTRHVVEMLRSNDKLAIADLTAKNEELRAAYKDLQAAQAELVEKERLERELEIAAEVQKSLLPDVLPNYPDLKLAAYLRPARQVGGDFYDAIELDEDHVAFVLADVADKSVQAALFMAVARTLFMVEAKRSLNPAEVALAVHRGVMQVSPSADIFVTAFYGVFNRQNRKLTYVIAGHERPLLIRPEQGVIRLEGAGRFLGMLDPLELQEQTYQLLPGDRLIIFSDGVPDSTNRRGQMYGYDRLHRFLGSNGKMSANELIHKLARDISSWSGASAAFDDLTLLALEVVGQDGQV